MILRTAVLVLTRDDELLDQVLAVATAAGVVPEVVSDPGGLAAGWQRAAVVVVGVDAAADLARTLPGRGPDLFLVGDESAGAELFRWSGPLGAAVVPFPHGAGDLTATLATIGGASGTGQLLAVIGGSGGVGASTCSAAVAVAAARRGLSCSLVDLDPLGGGLDLLFGAELQPGWRWSRLGGARGHLGDLTSELVHVDGVDLLSVDRLGDDVPVPAQVAAVLRSTARSHRLTVVDLPRAADAVATEVVSRADLLLIVARADIRGLASAQQLLRRLPTGPERLVLGRGSGSPLGADRLAERLGLGLLDLVPDDPQVRVGGQRGDAPGRSVRSRLARAADAVLGAVGLADAA